MASCRWAQRRRSGYQYSPVRSRCWIPTAARSRSAVSTYNRWARRTSSVASMRRSRGTVSLSPGGNTWPGLKPTTAAMARGIVESEQARLVLGHRHLRRRGPERPWLRLLSIARREPNHTRIEHATAPSIPGAPSRSLRVHPAPDHSPLLAHVPPRPLRACAAHAETGRDACSPPRGPFRHPRPSSAPLGSDDGTTRSGRCQPPRGVFLLTHFTSSATDTLSPLANRRSTLNVGSCRPSSIRAR